MTRIFAGALCALALAGCATAGPPPEPVVKTVQVAVPVARSCVPAGVAERPTDLPASVDDAKAQLRAKSDVAARYQLTLDWVGGFIARAAVTEPVVAGCR